MSPLPSILPLFPLPNVVLFPHVLLPLHIFEPRYREMVRDVAAGDELIGMILLRHPVERPHAAEPDTYSVGCAGRMIRRIDLPDGRSNILLQGVRTFVPREQSFERSYRTASVDWRATVPGAFRLGDGRRGRLVGRIREFTGKHDEPELRILGDPTVGDEMLVNLFAFGLDLPVAEKQSLLEVADVDDRAEKLIETLEFHLLERRLVPSTEERKTRLQ